MADGGVKKRLKKIAQTRTRVVPIKDESGEGVEVLVREVGADEFAMYGEMLDKKKLNAGRIAAQAYLLSCCIVEETESDPLSPVYTPEEAIDIARSARVSMPIVSAIMELSGFGDEEKKPGQTDAS